MWYRIVSLLVIPGLAGLAVTSLFWYLGDNFDWLTFAFVAGLTAAIFAGLNSSNHATDASNRRWVRFRDTMRNYGEGYMGDSDTSDKKGKR